MAEPERETIGFQPIHAAAGTGNNAEISRLVASGADVNAETYDVRKISYAVNRYGKPVRDPSTYPLLIALKNGHTSTILLLLDLGADARKPITRHKRRDGKWVDGTEIVLGETFVNSYYRDHLSWGAGNLHHQYKPRDHIKILEKMKEKGFVRHPGNFSNVLEFRDFRPRDGSIELLEYLLEEGANPDTRYSYWAKNLGYISIHNPCPRNPGSAPILQKYLNFPSIIKLLRSYGADITLLRGLGNYGHNSFDNIVRGYTDRRYYISDSEHGEPMIVRDVERTVKALTDPVELKKPRWTDGTSDDPRVPSLTAKIERLESQLLACGQSLATCESEKAFMRQELSSLEHEIGAVSERLARARGISREKDRTIDGLNRAKAAMEQTIEDLKTAIDNGLLTTNRLKAEIERLKEEIRILKGAAPREREGDGSAQEAPVPDPEPSSGFECTYPYNRGTATTRQRLDSCVPAQGGVFDNVRTATGGRYTHKQKCIEECYTP